MPGVAVNVDGAEGQDEVVVGEIECLCQIRLHDAYTFGGEVDGLDLDNQHARAAQHLAERLHDVGDCYVARGNFVQHRGKENEILFSGQHDFGIRDCGEPSLQLQRRIGPCKTTTENQNAFVHADTDSTHFPGV